MYAQADSTISSKYITGPFGCLIPPQPPHYGWVYLLHFSQRYARGRRPGHYLGSTDNLEARLQRHRAGNGARLVEVITEAGIDFEVSRLWRCDTPEDARALEHRLKGQHSGLRLCPYCTGKPVDVLTSMHQGHWPFHLFKQGKQRPLQKLPPLFVTR